MPKYFAFLRAVNVGGRTVKMDRLRHIFVSLGFTDVETFIASGNVVFQAKSQNAATLEAKISAALNHELGFKVAAFIRTEHELAELAAFQPFSQKQLDPSAAFNVILLAEPLDVKSQKKVSTLLTDIDDFNVHHREIYWLCRKKQSESTFSNVVLEKTLGVESTIRSMSTITKMVEKLFKNR